jgi:hypothetical protein
MLARSVPGTPSLHHATRVCAQIIASYIRSSSKDRKHTSATWCPDAAYKCAARCGALQRQKNTPHAACVMSRNSRTGYLYGLSSNQARLSMPQVAFCQPSRVQQQNKDTVTGKEDQTAKQRRYRKTNSCYMIRCPKAFGFSARVSFP